MDMLYNVKTNHTRTTTAAFSLQKVKNFIGTFFNNNSVIYAFLDFLENNKEVKFA